jgi:hypothetical protein
VAAVAGLLAGWIAAGAVGLLGDALRHALTWACLLVIVAAAWPSPARGWAARVALLAGLALAVVMTASHLTPINVAAVAIVLAAAAPAQSGHQCRVLWLASIAVASLALYRLTLTSIAPVWFAADALGAALGRGAGHLAHQPLSVGPGLAGLDFLVVMALVYACWLAWSKPPRWPRALLGAVAILGGHVLYLIVLSLSARVLRALPEPGGEHPLWWATLVRNLVPWDVPALAAVIQALVAAGLLRWAAWGESVGTTDLRGESGGAPDPREGARARLVVWGAVVLLAALVPVLTTLSCRKCSLTGKKIVVYEKGFLNWLKPEHGDYGHLSVGMYGLLPTYIESLGGRCLISPDLSDADLAGASVLILLYPNEPWRAGQLSRIWSFVQRGGSLIVFADHTTREADGGNRVSEVLSPTALRIPFDTAEWATGGWLQSYEAMAHPATTGIGDDRNQFGVVIGASVQAHWPARPLLVGRWGWADAGDAGSSAALLGNLVYDAGERLGEVVLAAEQPLGAGKVVVFGDTSSMTNGINVGAHLFTSRLLGYLADGGSHPLSPWRSALALLAALALAALWAVRLDERCVLLGGLAFAASLSLCTWVTFRAADMIPSGTHASPNNLAYLDTTHLEAYSAEAWRPDGTMGLILTLMRNGYLVLDLPEFTAERLNQAGLLVSVAPGRSFSPGEREIVRRFVEKGGVFICTVGYDDSRPSRSLLADLGFSVGGPPGKSANEPRPLGYFKSPYLRHEDYTAYVRFDAAWPVASTAGGAEVIAYGSGDTPVILARTLGQGKAVVIGDTGFAMDKNLENEGGEPFEGLRENADFWRWFLTYLRNQPQWIPPGPVAVPAPAAEAPTAASPGGESPP